MKTAVEILTAARDLIINIGWCTGHCAETKGGEAVYSDNPLLLEPKKLSCFCMTGALICASGSLPASVCGNESLNVLSYNIPGAEELVKVVHKSGADAGRVYIYNDLHTKKEVIEAFNQAIALAEKQAP